MNAAGGFPYTISLAGSYKLSGNLTVADGNTTAIVIASDDVTLDLNSFSIIGPVSCAGGFPCAGIGLGLGYGINAGSDSPTKMYFNITIRNGTIQGMGADGVHLLGDSILLEYLHVRSNGASGLVIRAAGSATGQNNSVLYHNSVKRNGGYGIKVSAGLITDNTVSESGSEGIRVELGGTVARNVVLSNTSDGLLLGNVSYVGNTMAGNNSGGSQVVGGVNLGQNLCNNVVCP